ncbi:MAG: hypothetical protein IKL57_05655 [Oscillospiraceae bacterium]|nr:hypothetical protein [Oscillospiraceae bacterium]
MKKSIAIIFFVLLAIIFCGCSPEVDLNPKSEPQKEEFISENPSEEPEEWEIVSGEFSEELTEWIYYCFPKERAEEIIEKPTENQSASYHRTFGGGKYIFTEAQFYHDKGGDPVHFSYIENNAGDIKIIPELLHWYLGFGVLSDDTLYFQHSDGVALYKVKDFEMAKTEWKPEKADISQVFHIGTKKSLAVFWAKGEGENLFVTLLDENAKEIYTEDTGIKAVYLKGDIAELGIISESYADFGVLRFLNPFDDFHPYDLEVDTGKIIDLEGVFGANDPPTHKEGPHLVIFEGEGGKFGLKDGEKIIVEAIYDSMELRQPNRYYGEPPFTHFYEGYIIDGTKESLEFIGEKQIPTIVTEERKIYTLFDPNGKQMNDILFEDYEVSDGMNGYADETAYYYEYDGEKFICIHEEKPDKAETGFGYYITAKPWGPSGILYFGISDKNGNTILEPIYSKLEMPFADRICRFNGSSARQGWEESQCEITDIEGNIICDKFNTVSYTVFDDGSYIGWAIAGNSYIKTFDENKNPMPQGFWFVDKDGKIISEHFTEFDFTSEKLGKDTEIEVTLADGTQKTINTNDYILKG